MLDLGPVHSLNDLENWLVPYVPVEGSLALDVGANDGVWSRFLSTRFDQVHAFEPQPLSQLRMLSPSNVRIIEVAVGSHVGKLDLHLYYKSVHASYDDAEETNSDRGPSTGVMRTPLVSLDAMGYDRHEVDFIKVDVEGLEFEVLDGAYNSLENSMPVLIVEIHNEQTGLESEEMLKALDYKITSIPHPHPDAGPHHRWLHAVPN